MALSRFWSFIIACSVLYIFFLLATGKSYTISNVVNGSQNDPVLIAEYPAGKIQIEDTLLYANILANPDAGYPSGDTTYRLTDKGIVEVYAGKQQADGIFATCKNTIMDLWLPLIGYLTFFCGLLHLLSDSNAIDKLARFLTPLFARIFPELPKGHPAYGFMTMNFAANFLGLDNAATPFGLKIGRAHV